MAQYVDQEGNQLWTIDEAARQWGVSPRRVYKWIKGRDGESRGLYRNADGEVFRRFSKSARTRLPEGSYALYPVGRRSIYLIRPQPYPEPILAAFERPYSASHPGERTSEISYEANGMESQKYGYSDSGTFVDPYASDAAMYAPKTAREEADETPRQTQRKRQAVSEVEARGRRPLATQEEISAAEAAKSERAAKKVERAAQKATRVPPGTRKVETTEAENLPTPPFYKIEIFDETNPRENIVRYGKFPDDETARGYAFTQLDMRVPQYLVIVYSPSMREDEIVPLSFYATPRAEQNSKKFPEQVKSLLKQYNFATKPGAAFVFPKPEVIGAGAPVQSVQPSAEETDEAVPDVARPRSTPIIERKAALTPPVTAPAASKAADPAKQKLAIKTAKSLVDKEIADRLGRLEIDLDAARGDDAGLIAKISLLSSPEAKKAIRAEVEQKIESGQIDSADPKLIKALFSAAQAAVTGALKRA
jgi:hypothetical protein